MRRIAAQILLCLGLVVGLFIPGSVAQAAAVSCFSHGMVNEVTQFGSCTTTLNPGQVFYDGSGTGVIVMATGDTEAISFWSSPGALNVTPGQTVCLEWAVNYTQGQVSQELLLSANGVLIVADSRPIHPGYQQHCFQLPSWATNAWWQLKTTVDGGANSTSFVSVTFLDAYGQ